MPRYAHGLTDPMHMLCHDRYNMRSIPLSMTAGYRQIQRGGELGVSDCHEERDGAENQPKEENGREDNDDEWTVIR